MSTGLKMESLVGGRGGMLAGIPWTLDAHEVK